jgi:hypothetical protein
VNFNPKKMQPIPYNQLPLELQKITKVKTWYRAAEYKNMLFLDIREKYYEDWSDYEDQNETVDTWLYGTESYFYVPDVHNLVENIEIFEGAWDRVKEECKEELIIIESSLRELTKKMIERNIVGYAPNYKVGVVNI